jgi:glutamate synthase domain-containing protein 2
MSLGWEFFLAVSLGFLITALAGLILWKPALNLWADSFLKRLMQDPYPENIGEMYNVFAKVGIQNVFESDLRGTTGKPLQRPFGSPKHFSAWEKLTFNCVYLSRKPVLEAVAIDTKTVIGPQAKRPLYIDLPIIIAGMAYGAGPSLRAKLALAKGADQENTATNTGVGPFLPEERKHTKRLIIQYNRGYWTKEEEVLRQADAVEIQLGYGALGSAPRVWSYQDLSPEFRDYMHLQPDENMLEEAMLPNVKSRDDLVRLVKYLRKVTNGAPIGIKFGATHWLEKELEIFTGADIDFLTVSGAEAGINYGPAISADDLGLPTLPALCRSARFLKEKKLQDKVSLIIDGGLATPGQFMKALALGADVVGIGTIALLVIAHTQVSKTIPWEPPTELVYERGKYKDRLDIDTGAKSLANFLKSCKEEMILGMRTLGKTSLRELAPEDLSAVTPEAAEMTGVDLNLFPPGKSGLK